jgi:hypothetical protein
LFCISCAFIGEPLTEEGPDAPGNAKRLFGFTKRDLLLLAGIANHNPIVGKPILKIPVTQ